MKFKGTLVITDPCYLDSYSRDHINNSWWEESDYGKHMEQYGFTSYIGKSTIIGDWQWYVYNEDTKKLIGKFSADAGMICVCLLEEVLKFNPNFAAWALEHPWCVTVIPNFDGNVEYIAHSDHFELVGNGNINFTTS